MNTVLVVTPDDALRARLLRALSNCSIFEAASDGEALKTLRMVEIDVVVRDGSGPRGAMSAFVASVREVAPSAQTLAIGVTGEDLEAADFNVSEGFTTREVAAVLRHALEKRRMAQELAAFREMPAVRPATSAQPAAGHGGTLTRALKDFTRVFAVGFDVRRVLDTFLDAVGDLVRPTRMALLLPDTEGQEFRIVAQRGLAPQIVQSVRLAATEGLPAWLAAQARVAAFGEVRDPECIREMKVLQAVVATPLLAHGELVGILMLGQPVLGVGYPREDLEALFDLGTHLATVIRDITLHQRLEREKEFTERILAHMSSGVITIGRDHTVGLMNRRAEEILGMPAQGAIGQDLRILPSPLGDILFDTLTSGRGVTRSEVQLALNKLWLEISTYVVRDEETSPLGAVVVFEDLTAQKELAAQKREAEQFQLLTRVVARIADEIKNPLVSINTFVELIGERYEDPDFRRHFSSVVRRDVRRLVEVFEKLVGLVTDRELNFLTVDAYEVVTQLVESIDLADDGVGKHLQLDVAPQAQAQAVRIDLTQLRRALSYLIRYLTHNSPADLATISLAVNRDEEQGREQVRITVGSRTAEVSPEKLQRLFDPVQMVQESLIDVGPAVSQRLVEALGGHLRFRQTRNDLSFVVTLPAATA